MSDARRGFSTDMPELNNIQTFEKLQGTDFKPTLDRFEAVLRRIGLWNKEIENEFKDLTGKLRKRIRLLINNSSRTFQDKFVGRKS